MEFCKDGQEVIKMIKVSLQFFGGRGASSSAGRGSGGNTFRNAEDLEKSLSGIDDPRYSEFANAYNAESSYNDSLKKNIERSIDEDGYTDTIDESLNFEKKDAERQLKSMPKMKTAAEVGTEEALKERIEIVNKLKKRKGEKGKGIGEISILYGE